MCTVYWEFDPTVFIFIQLLFYEFTSTMIDSLKILNLNHSTFNCIDSHTEMYMEIYSNVELYVLFKRKLNILLLENWINKTFENISSINSK